MIVEGILCIRFVHMCISDSIVRRRVPVKDGDIGKFITHSSVLCYVKVHGIIIMGMLLGFDSYTKCVLILYKLFCSVFTIKNMHLPIVLCCNMKKTLFIYQQNLIISLYQV